ncbi:zinc-binding protein A33-like isoform X1 [Stegostoma tigrinum]|uniref:zinc-binding protein A33-like isoform X1 n=1 Tax=Stegostoma tigrinum TaxID=3053191 RepID=UPI00202B03EA|nr:zinc-binding protein A33-like isoform X1 [Stegostoma tigrinum]
MAVSKHIVSLNEDLTCSICQALFVEPVRLQCEHNFCKSCIQKCWGKQRQAVSCPQCQLVLPRRSYTSNRVLASLCEKTRRLDLNLKLEEDRPDCEGPGESVKQVCEEHGEKLILFCEEDEVLICASCVDSHLHSNHKFLPVQQAVQKYMDQLNASLDSMEEEKKCKSELKQQQEGKISELDELSVSLEEDISTQFAKIRQYLDEKEKHLKEGLSRQKQADLRLMEENLKEFKVEITSLDEKIGNLRADIEQQDGITFLKELQCLRERYLDKGEEGDDGEHSQSSGDGKILTFSRRKYLDFQGPLLYITWKQMKQIISPVPASLTLDPNTAHCGLFLSQDLTRVRVSDSKLQRPNNPQRFDTIPCVLGSQGFTSGKHYWEVGVGDKTVWALGVAGESSNRKGKFSLRPEHSYWTVWLNGQGKYIAIDRMFVHLTPSVKPGTIGVYLDYEGGKVSFYNADNMSILYMFTDTFTEKLFPFFCPGLREATNCAPLVLHHIEL